MKKSARKIDTQRVFPNASYATYVLLPYYGGPVGEEINYNGLVLKVYLDDPILFTALRLAMTKEGWGIGRRKGAPTQKEQVYLVESILGRQGARFLEMGILETN